MRILSNDDVEKLLTMTECIAVLEEMYQDYARGQALHVPRVDSLSPSTEPAAYYAFKQMGGAWPRRRVQALRVNSDVITHPVIAGAPRRVKQPKANGRWVGLVFLFSTDTGALLAVMPDGAMQRLRVGAASGIALKHLAREDVRTVALIGSGWQAGAQLMAALATRAFREVRVYSPRPERRAAFVADVKTRDPGVDIRGVALSARPRRWSVCWTRDGSRRACTSAASRHRKSIRRSSTPAIASWCTRRPSRSSPTT
jgi:ornithine cyclodeaminase/alanine dehydrogenase-like protein (mu-crystallin family)